MSEEYKLTYFDSRGMGESIRLILKLADVPFEDIRVPNKNSDTDMPAAGDNEPCEGSRFPASMLPVLEIGDKVLKSSEFLGSEVSICRFLARKFGLEGADEFEAARIERIVEDFYAIRFLSMMNTGSEREMDDGPYFFGEAAAEILDGLEKTLVDNEESEWYVGRSVSWADIYAVYVLDLMDNISGLEREELHKVFDRYPKVMEHMAHVYAIPQISAWSASRPPVNEADEEAVLSEFNH